MKQVDLINSDVSYGNGNTGCGNSTITKNTAHITNIILIQQPHKVKSEILEWISPLELPDRHHDVRKLRFPGVGDWILGTPQFKSWEDGSAHPVLFCDGDPGAGKTCISSLVIDTLCPKARERKFRVFYLYCNYREELSAADLIAGLLKKVVAGLDGTPEKVSQEFEGSEVPGSDRMRPLLPDVEDTLGTVLASFERAFICIDALDELPQKQIPQLLDSLAKLILLSSKIRLFLTGRPPIRREIGRWFGKGAQILSIRAKEEDIKKYITRRLDQDPNPDVMDSELKSEIVEILPQKASGIFLLVHLRMNAILGEVSVQGRRDRLLEGLELCGEYSNTLRRINGQDASKSNLALRVLMWLCYSKRPLCANELSHALAVEKGSTSFNPRRVSPIQMLLSCCLGLVAVDTETSSIHFIHSTLKDYLNKESKIFQGTDLTIAETCLTYLNTGDVTSLSPSLGIALEKTPFLQYASCYWGEHAREETTDHTKALAKNLLGLYPGHISAKLLLLGKSGFKCLPDGFSGLHCAAFFGLQEIAIAFLDTEVPKLSQRDITGSTPLAWAARNGHRELVQLLLKRGSLDAQTGDNDGCTPFSWAARNGHAGVVELFLRKGAIGLETKDSFGRTPLSWASGNGHQGVVELLVNRQEIKPETKDWYGRTPLSWASGGGHIDVIKLLLKTGKVYLSSTDNEGRTPVSWAAEGGHEGVVSSFLCRQDVDLNLSDCDGRTLLSRAAESGHRMVVKLLLDQNGIAIDTVDNNGMTPLSWAASKGNEAVVKLFMEKGRTGTDLVDKDCSASLWWAARSGRTRVVRLMLEREGVDPNFVGEYGRTPLVRAAMHGHEKVVKLLLESGRVKRNIADRLDRTPLSWAAGSGHDKVVELLLKSGGIDIEFADKSGQTPFLLASRCGRERVAQLLLEENVKPDSRDTAGRTPVSWAAGEGHEKLVDILLSRSDVDPNSVDNARRTPLLWATINRQDVVIKLLLDRNDIELNAADSVGRTPLSWAAGNGREAVAGLLLSRRNIEPDAADSVGRTPLSWAAGNGCSEVVKLLIGRSDVNPDSADNSGLTPLSWACKNRHQGAVRLLQKDKPVSTTPPPPNPIPEPRPQKLNFVVQKPIVGSSLPKDIIGYRLLAYVLSCLFQIFPYLIVLWAFCLCVCVHERVQ